MSRQLSLSSSQPVSKSQKLSPSPSYSGERPSTLPLPLPLPPRDSNVSASNDSCNVASAINKSTGNPTPSNSPNVQITQRIPGQIEGWITDHSVLLRPNSHDESHSIRRIYDIDRDKLSSVNLHLSAENDLMSRIRGSFTLLNSDLFALTDVILGDDLSASTFINVCSRNQPHITNSFSMPNINALTTLRTGSVDANQPPQIAVVEMKQHSTRKDLSSNDVTVSASRRQVPLSPIVNVDGAASTPLPPSLALSLEFRCHYLTTDGTTTHITPLARVALVQEPVATHSFAISTDSDEVWVCVVCAFSDCPTPYKDHEGLPITAPDVRLILIRMSRAGVSAVTIRDAHLLKLRCVNGELNANEYCGYFCGGRLLLRCEDHLFWFYPDSALFTLWDIRWLLTDSVEEDSRNDRQFVVSDSILLGRGTSAASPSPSYLILNSPSHGLMSIDVFSNTITSIDEEPTAGKLFLRGHSIVSVKEEKERTNLKQPAARSTCLTKISPILIDSPSALQRKPSIGSALPTLNLTETPSPATVVRRHSLPVQASVQTAKRKL